MEIIAVLIYIFSFFAIFITLVYTLNLLKQNDIKIKNLKKWPKVAIIVPAYNEEKNVKDTLETLANLDYPKDKYKIIFVDDGSTDKTYEKAIELANKFNKNTELIKVFRKRNGGKASALNFGIKKVLNKVDYIVCMDADSLADKNALKELVKTMESLDNSYMACVSTMNVYNPKNWIQKIQAIEYYISNFFRKVFFNANWIYITPGPFSIYKAEFFKKHGLFKEDDITEDTEIGLRIKAKNYKIAYAQNSIVYTKAPDTIISLVKQRRRWYLGLIEDILNYKTSLKNMGELGFFVLPSIIFMWSFIVLITLLILKEQYFEQIYYWIKDLIILKTDVIYLIEDYFKDFSISFKFTFYHFFTIISVIITFLFFLASLYSYKKLDKKWFSKKSLFFWFIIMILVYPILYTIFIFSVYYSKFFSKELKFGNLRWRNSLINRIKRKFSNIF